MIDADSGFFVRLPFEQTIHTMMEIKNAFPLLWWYIGRITRDYSATGLTVRIGAVLGHMPITDGYVASELSASGGKIGADKIKHWRRKLEAGGYIATLRTPCGLRVFVIGSEKFPEESIEPLPDWALSIVQEAAAKRSAKLADRRISPRDRRTTPRDVQTSPSDVRDSHIQYKKQKGNRKESERRQKSAASEALAYDSPELKITARLHESLGDAFPWVDREGEYPKIRAWLHNHAGQIKNTGDFTFRWFDHIPEPVEPGLDIPLAKRPF